MAEISLLKIENYKDIFAPDSAEFDLETKRIKIVPETVVVRANNGDIINRYHDDIWDIRHYGSDSQLTFNKFREDKESVKQLIYAILIFGGNSNTVVPGTTLHGYFTVLFGIHKETRKQSITLKDGLKNEFFMYEYAKGLNDSVAAALNRLIKLLFEISNYIGIKIYSSKNFSKLLIAKHCNHQNTQYPIIPIEIYANSYNQRWKHFQYIKKNIDDICTFIVKYANNPYFARNTVVTKEAKEKSIPFEEAISRYGLKIIFQYYKVRDYHSLKSFVQKIIINCAHLIAASTGMRKSELKLLRQDCFKDGNKQRPPTITGYEKKTNHGIPRPQDWITHSDIKEVVIIAEKLGSAMINGLPISDTKNIPLLIKVSTFANRRNMQNTDIIYNISLINSLSMRYEFELDKSTLILTQNMMDNFLKKTHRVGRWTNEERWKVGKTWIFTWHQYRRSYAFYAINSGLVSISTLKRQLAHTLQSTAAYYSNGAVNIEPLVTNGKNHIKREIDEMRQEQTAIALTYHVLTNKAHTSEVLDKWARDMIEPHENQEDFINQAISKVKKEIKKGHMYAKNTPLGLCTKGDDCDAYFTFSFMECAECEHSERIKDKIDRSIEVTSLSIVELAEMGYADDSIEMKTQYKELEFFKEQKKKCKA